MRSRVTSQPLPPRAQRSTLRPRRARKRPAVRTVVFLVVMLTPSIIGFGYWVVVPTVLGVGLSFTDASLLSPPNWIGLDNYSSLAKDPVFWRSVYITTVYVVAVMAPTIVIGVIAGRLLSEKRKLNGLFMTIYFIPFIAPGVSMAIVFAMLFSTYGVVNQALRIQFPWLLDSNGALAAVTVATAWGMIGYYTLILAAAFHQVPDEIKEAANLDGANVFQRLLLIELPLIRPTMVFCLVTGVASVMTNFATPAVLANGGPLGATTTLPVLVYNETFSYGGAGRGSAIAMTMLVMGLLAAVAIMVINHAGARRATG